jgi:adenylate kinase family enzyme
VRVHILGASGSGTTTLGAALASRLGHAHFDTDDFFWLPTEPKFLEIRPAAARIALLTRALDAAGSWVLSGSLCGWGDVFIPRFDLVIFLFVSREIRLARLLEREQRRFGAEALAPGGAMHAAHGAFMAWAGGYDDGGEDMRSRRMHERWLAALPCPVIRLEEPRPVAEQMARLAERLASPARSPSARATGGAIQP